jgi:hypothetical protein
MSYQIYSDIPNRVVSVLVDNNGTFAIIGDVNHKFTVDLSFAEVHVNGGGINQAQRVVGIEDGSCYRVWILNGQVRVDPSP